MTKLFSQTNKKALKELKPDLGLRSWNDLTPDDKNKIWRYLEWHFFDKDVQKQYEKLYNQVVGHYYIFYGSPSEQEYKKKIIQEVIYYLNEQYKVRSYAKRYLDNPTLNNACYDFYKIFMEEDEIVVLELLSFYGRLLFNHTKNDYYIHKEDEEPEEDFKKRKINAEYEIFDGFADRVNNVFEQFGINYSLTRDGFIPRQDKKITEEIYVPVLNSLSDPKWKEANRELRDAFSEFQKKSPNGYSNCITHTVSALQAFLQLLVHGKTGKGDINNLIPEAQKRKQIPDEQFSTKIFKDIESILMTERQATSDAHPKKEYATQKHALLVLNLTMVFLQHCIQNE